MNVGPTAILDHSGAASEGEWITVTFLARTDVSGDMTGFTYAFDYTNDGLLDQGFGASSQATFRATHSSTQPVRGLIRDDDGGVSEYLTAVPVSDVPPSLTLAGASYVAEGAIYTLVLKITSEPGTTLSRSGSSSGGTAPARSSTRPWPR